MKMITFRHACMMGTVMSHSHPFLAGHMISLLFKINYYLFFGCNICLNLIPLSSHLSSSLWGGSDRMWGQTTWYQMYSKWDNLVTEISLWCLAQGHLRRTRCTVSSVTRLAQTGRSVITKWINIYQNLFPSYFLNTTWNQSWPLPC